MSLDARKCAELLAIRERATPGPWIADTVIRGLPRFLVADCGPVGKVYPVDQRPSHGTTSMDDAAFIASAHDLADALRDALALLSECRKVAYNLQNEHPALSDLLDKLTEAGIE